MVGRTSRALLVLAAVLGWGCARHAASRATEGALEKLKKEQAEAPRGQRPAEITGQRAVEGAMEKLSSPEEMAILRRVAGDAAAAAVDRALAAAVEPRAGGPSPVARLGEQAAESMRATLVRGLEADLGEGGALAASLGATAHRAAAAAADGALGRLFPGCPPDDGACLNRRIAALGQDTAAGVGTGLKQSLGLLGLGLAFAAGAAAALLLVLVIRLEGRRRAWRAPASPAHAS